MLSVPHEKFILSNGLEVILHEDHSLPIVSVNVWYHVGSKDEDVGRTGFAHLFEHMMFEGSGHHKRGYFEPLQKVGATVNGSTTSDRTNYWENLPSNYIELALWLEGDRMGFLLEALDQERLDIQRDIVKNERRQSYENRPYGKASLLLQPALFPSPHRYSWPVIGSQEDLERASLDDVKGFFKRYYAPSNASLAVGGDITFDEVMRLVERHFGDLPPGPAIDRVSRTDSSLRGEMVLKIRDKVQLPRIYLSWPSCHMFDPSEPALDILAMVLADGKSSRLYKSLIYEKQIATDVQVVNHSQEIAGEFQIQVTASPGHTLDDILTVIEEELEVVRTQPPTKYETKRAKNRIESDRARYLERIGGFGGRVDFLNYYNVFAGDPAIINSDMDRIMAVTSDEVVRVARQVLGNDRVRLDVLPEYSFNSAPATIDRSIMPIEAAQKPFAPPCPQRERLDNGLDVLYIEKPGVPMVSTGLYVPAGAITDTPVRPGLAHMTATMLAEGTTTRSSQQIAEEMEFLGTQLDIEVGREYVMVAFESMTSHWAAALDVLADVVKNSIFPMGELDRVRRENITDLNRVGDYPVMIAERAARSLVYGPDSRMGHPVTGTVASMEVLTQHEIVDHYNAYYGPDRATIIVVGDVKGSDALSKAEFYFGDWASNKLKSPGCERVDVTSSVAPTTIYLADKPGAAQSVVRAGQLTVSRHDPDFYALNLLNYVFGGQPTSRLFMNLREDKGYSYGYYSSIDWALERSMILAGGAVQTEVTQESVVETLKEFADITGGRPVTEEEYNNARDGIFRGFPAGFETQNSLMHQISRLVAFGLPDDYLSTLIAKLESVTLQDIHRAAERALDDSRLSILVVGDCKIIEPGLRDLGLPIVPVDHEGRSL